MRLTIRNTDSTVSQPYPCDWEAVMNKLAEYEDLEEQGRLLRLPCAIGDPLYWISPEDDDGNEIETVKDCQGGVRAFVVTAHEIRVADKDQALELIMDSTELGTQYAYLTLEEAEAALKGADE